MNKLRSTPGKRTRTKVARSTFSRRSLHGQTAITLGRAIASGEFNEGDLLPPDTELMEYLDCSRSVLREATLVLTAKGMLESRPRLGTRIRPRIEWSLLDPDVIDWVAGTAEPKVVLKLCQMRLMIEPAVARIAAIDAPQKNLDAIYETFQRMEETVGSLEDFIPHDLAFHELIIQSGENEFLGALGSIIRDAVLTAMIVLQVPETLRRSRLELHRSVCKAICDRDGEQAADAMHKLVEAANSDVLNALKKRPATKRNNG